MMKKLLIIAMVLFAVVSCKKQPKVEPNVNYMTYDGEKLELVWGGVYKNEYVEDDINIIGGYCFGVSTTTPAGQLFDEPTFFEVDLAPEMLGVKLNWDTNYDCPTWMNYGYFGYNSASYEDLHFFTEGDELLAGSWVKITSLAKPNHYTFEFDMIIDGKHLTGYYSGEFVEKFNYDDVGENEG